MSIWEDVRWSWSDARTAALTLHRIADELEALRQQRMSNASLVSEEASGPYRVDFELDLKERLLTRIDLSKDCHNLAQRIEDLTNEARSEQARRERARERWRLEQEHGRNPSEF